ncbi:tetrapyrrole methylase [Hyaloraphidium curvatum]|nr:tetrapyrrole methylase [Hyaloraphidium curvatum]
MADGDGSASLMLAWRLSGPVLVVGGGYEAVSRVRNLLPTGARIHLVAPTAELHKSLRPMLPSPKIVHHDRPFVLGDMDMEEWEMVLSCLEPDEEDAERSTTKAIYAECRRRKIPVNCADVVDCCQFWFMSNFSDGPVQVGISTNGNAPGLSRRIKFRLQSSLESGTGPAVAATGRLRAMLKDLGVEQNANGTADAPRTDAIPPTGKVVLVGAGPGDPSLITVAALDALRTADLVVSDRLVPQPVLDLVDPAKLVLAPLKSGSGGKSDEAQGDTNALVAAAISSGRARTVARLKIGDPFVYGRGGEELLYFRSLGHSVTVVPGLSSATAAPCLALIPPTHRGAADQVLLVTGRGEGGGMPELPEFHAKRTLLVLMGLGRLAKLCDLCREKGYPEDLPVAIVERAGHADMRVTRGTVGTIGEVVAATVPPVESPVTMVFGNVVDVLAER